MSHHNKHDLLESRDDLAAVVEGYRKSGLSLKAFAREHGIRPARLHYWVYQKHQRPKARSLTEAERAGPRAVFQEVKLDAGSAWLESWAAEVRLGRGVNVRFSGTARPDWIGAVVQALQRPC